MWLVGVMVRALDSFSSNNLGHVVHTHMPPSPNSIIWYQSCSWRGNRRSDVALAMHLRLQWFILGMPPTLLMGYGKLYLYLTAHSGRYS